MSADDSFIVSSRTTYTSLYRSSRRSRPFTSRFLKRTQYNSTDDENDETQETPEPVIADEAPAQETRKKKNRYQNHPTVLNGGTVIRLRREVSTTSEDEDDEVSSEETIPVPEEPEPEPEPEPVEDPLDREERELKDQLMLSLTLTLVEEENIRYRLLEIQKSRLRKDQQSLEDHLVQKFVIDVDVTLFENQPSSAKEEEERILTQK